MILSGRRRTAARVMLIVAMVGISGCADWRGLNSLPLPGTQGSGPGSFVIQAQMPDVNNLQQNSRVRVADVTVGNVTKIERQDWHALVTMSLNGDVDLPANAIAKLGQTSLLGSQHIELAPPTDAPPQGKLHDGSLIPLAHSDALPDHRADAGGAVDGAQRRRNGPITGHHRGFQYRVPGAREGSAKPDRATGQIHRVPQRPDRRHHRGRREPEPTGRTVSRAATRRGSGAGDHPRRAGGAERAAGKPCRRGRSARQIRRPGHRHRQPIQGERGQGY